jgi:hypothetical protein
MAMGDGQPNMYGPTVWDDRAGVRIVGRQDAFVRVVRVGRARVAPVTFSHPTSAWPCGDARQSEKLCPSVIGSAAFSWQVTQWSTDALRAAGPSATTIVTSTIRPSMPLMRLAAYRTHAAGSQDCALTPSRWAHTWARQADRWGEAAGHHSHVVA